ncbi:MAG: acetyl ornithine aminotransferase family protein [Candidatus Bathyarchaeota archaeon]|jgi:4-aminobutyrate aminotransferase
MLKGPKVSSKQKQAKKIVDLHNQVIMTTTMVPYPLVASEAQGALVKDVDGNVYLDFSSAVAVVNVGHNHPEVVKAVKTQAEKLIHFAGNDYYNPLQAQLAQELVNITPGKFGKKVFFSNSGAESVECAFKLARWHMKKPNMISFFGAFHGRTFGALSLSACKGLHKKFFSPLVPSIVHVPYAYCYRCPFKLSYPNCGVWCASYIDEVLLHLYSSEDIAGLIVEPIQGEAGYVVPPKEFLPKLKKICDENGFLLLVDEVQTGFGRTGKMFVCEHTKTQPDIICLSKALAAGLPMGATVAKSEVADWEEGSHSNTFGGNMLACAASLANIQVIKKEKLAEKAVSIGEHALNRLNEMKEKSEIIGDVRGKGLMIGVEFVKDKQTKEKAVKEAEKITIEAFKKGLVLLPVGVNCIRIAPPLNIPLEQLDKGLDILFDAIKTVEKGFKHV